MIPDVSRDPECGKAEWRAFKMECSEKHNIQLEDAKNAVHGKTLEADVTHELKCYFLCMGEKQKLIKDGTFQALAFTEALASNPDKELVAKAATECSVKGTDNCDTGYKVAKCIAKNKLKKHLM
ncbi:general odorant-binding protein 56h-like isoform X2 [Episyrphus balteatus]|uniref:general odorant-binding protein 56h-like isoform X2 n=1 Tax=Episyrphus balteatus TaxID=286459 RepID=UPI002485847C|nr:general odorant-binding protein 56h-like isoform X2 [Episyrphus balteatus]